MVSCDTVIVGTCPSRAAGRAWPSPHAASVDHTHPDTTLPRRFGAQETTRGHAAHPPSRMAASAA